MNNISYMVSGANIAQFSKQTNFSCKYLSDFTIFVKYSEFVSSLVVVIDLMLRIMGILSYILYIYYWELHRNRVILLHNSRLLWLIF